jgi:hypothetical protein
MRATPFDQQLAALKHVFGDRWLSGRVPEWAGNQKNKSPSRNVRLHELQVAWKDLQAELASRYSGRVITSHVDLRHFAAPTLIERVATAVFRLPQVPGFQTMILPRLQRQSEFESALHECEVASWFAKDGLHVEFVPTESLSGRRSPDLRVSAQGGAIEVECKLKGPIKPSILTQSSRDALSGKFRLVLERLNVDIEGFGLIIGPDAEDTIAAAIGRIESLASGGFRGHSVETDLPMFVTIDDSPINIPDFTFPEYISWAKSRSCTEVYSQPLPLGNGKFRFSHHRGMGVVALDGHTFDQVDDSIITASRQLSPGKLGIVVINVDLAGGPGVNVSQEMYLRLLERALSHRTWGGGRNTRIGAIVLKLSVTEDVANLRFAYTRGGNKSLCVVKPGLERPNDISPSILINCLLRASDRAAGII